MTTKKSKKKNNNVQNIIMFALAIAVVGMTIGFAAYSATLNIGGNNNVTVTAAKWDIHWDDDSYEKTTNSTNDITVTTPVITATSMTFELTLPKPGSIYEFEIDAKNAGTFDADLSKVTLGVTGDTNYANYLTYSLSYDGDTYTTIGDTTVAEGESILTAGSSKTAKVRIEYKKDITSDKLPSADKTLTITASLLFSQSE